MPKCRTMWECAECGHVHDTKEAARLCESEHVLERAEKSFDFQATDSGGDFNSTLPLPPAADDTEEEC
jgi:uncharacterized Zn finger protein